MATTYSDNHILAVISKKTKQFAAKNSDKPLFEQLMHDNIKNKASRYAKMARQERPSCVFLEDGHSPNIWFSTDLFHTMVKKTVKKTATAFPVAKKGGVIHRMPTIPE
jgi:hypothetical protein